MTRAEQKTIDAVRSVISVRDTLVELLPSTSAALESDIRTRWAVEMGLIRVGEGINRVPEEVLNQFGDQRWRQIISMRNFAAHQYGDLDPRRV